MRNTAEHVVTDLVSAGLVDPASKVEAENVVSRALGGVPAQRTAPAARAGARTQLVEIAGYAGGALVIASVALFLAQYWNDFSATVQVAALALITVVIAAAGVTVTRVGGGYAQMRTDGRVRARLASALLIGASVAAGFTVARQVARSVDDASSWPALSAGLTILVLATVAYRYAPSVLGPLVLAVALFDTVINAWTLVDENGENTLWPGVALLLAAVVWLVLAEVGWFHEQLAARSLGVVLALYGAQMPLFDGDHNNVAYALTALVAVAGFTVYVRTVAWPYMLAGVFAVTLVVTEAVIDWTHGSLGVAGGVLLAGLTLLGASLAGLRVRHEVTEPEPQEDEKEPVAH